ncbi:hypothetical protein BCS29_09170 [Salmonella enterica]|nr:hypothetical protein [Salmonella enterica]
MQSRNPLLPLAKTLFYKDFLCTPAFGVKFQGQKLHSEGQLLAFQGQKSGAKWVLPRISGAKMYSFRGKNWRVESRGFLFGGQISGAINPLLVIKWLKCFMIVEIWICYKFL